MMNVAYLLTSIHSFARAGGGGSGSGGGGSIIVLIGYAPMHLLGAYFRRISRKHRFGFDGLQVIGLAIAIIYAVF